MRAAMCLLLVAACTGDPDGVAPDPSGDPQQIVLPAGCDVAQSLYGMSDGGPISIGPRIYDTGGTVFCLELDARDNIHIAHFAAGTSHEQASEASFQLALFGSDDTMLREGWDVTFGGGTAFANVEYGIRDRVVVEAKLFVRAKAAATSTDLRLYLFEPYE
jgi:hypothetical protein